MIQITNVIPWKEDLDIERKHFIFHSKKKGQIIAIKERALDSELGRLCDEFACNLNQKYQSDITNEQNQNFSSIEIKALEDIIQIGEDLQYKEETVANAIVKIEEIGSRLTGAVSPPHESKSPENSATTMKQP